MSPPNEVLAEAPAHRPVARTAPSVQVTAATKAGQGKLINIDNGGTLTDICVIDSDKVYRTKTLTTPYDLSKCLFEGLKKASREIYGEEDVQKLLLSTEYIRYSTTQGTNALVERKGPRLGLIIGGALQAAALQTDEHSGGLFEALVGNRVQVLDLGLQAAALEAAITRAVTTLSSAGANRIVVAIGGAERNAQERQIKRVLLKKFPQHLLGALPILYSHEVVEDSDDVRRTWTTLFNAFLHPAMERFLYNAEHKLREFRTKNPLLIFRNDGYSARVAKTIAIKTYSSGPRGGAEGALALARHYGFRHLLSMDVGGTTTDITLVDHHQVRTDRHGRVEGIETSFPLCNVESHGVGGSSIIKVVDGKVVVGPESVGGAPGPACFGLGGKEATITDAFLLSGLLDPASYFGGELRIDIERAKAVVADKIAKPLGISETEAARQMEAAWVAKIADSLRHFAKVTPDTTLAAFGGAGPFVVCKVAEAIGISRVIIPGLAAVFSAFGIGFSDIGHQYEAPLASTDAAELAAARVALTERAQRGMFAEGASLDDCRRSFTLQRPGAPDIDLGTEAAVPAGTASSGPASLVLTVVKPIAHTTLSGAFGTTSSAALQLGTRRILSSASFTEVPLFQVEQLRPGAGATGPAVLEEAFFTCRIDTGWRFEINAAGDILLTRI
jgi:N-methylhydantoinase A/oxoprolinase/acetone carboxylase beta subunit